MEQILKDIEDFMKEVETRNDVFPYAAKMLVLVRLESLKQSIKDFQGEFVNYNEN